MSSVGSSAPLPRAVVVVLCPRDHPALGALPRGVANFVIGHDAASLDPHLLPLAEALLVLPYDQAAVTGAGELLRGGRLPKVRWVHCYTAGVDKLSGFMSGPLAEAGLPLSNGRGAFSSSLAEYAMMAALHFNKQVPRCQANRAGKQWEKFQMPVLRGQTLGLLGFGDIAKHTATLARAFGMRVIALRRNAGTIDPDSALLDLTLGPYQGPILESHKRALLEQSDLVVSTLPGTPESHHFMSREEFGIMKPGATFVSVGRGSVVDEAALAAALGSPRSEEPSCRTLTHARPRATGQAYSLDTLSTPRAMNQRTHSTATKAARTPSPTHTPNTYAAPRRTDPRTPHARPTHGAPPPTAHCQATRAHWAHARGRTEVGARVDRLCQASCVPDSGERRARAGPHPRDCHTTRDGGRGQGGRPPHASTP